MEEKGVSAQLVPELRLAPEALMDGVAAGSIVDDDTQLWLLARGLMFACALSSLFWTAVLTLLL